MFVWNTAKLNYSFLERIQQKCDTNGKHDEKIEQYQHDKHNRVSVWIVEVVVRGSTDSANA